MRYTEHGASLSSLAPKLSSFRKSAVGDGQAEQIAGGRPPVIWGGWRALAPVAPRPHLNQ